MSNIADVISGKMISDKILAYCLAFFVFTAANASTTTKGAKGREKETELSTLVGACSAQLERQLFRWATCAAPNGLTPFGAYDHSSGTVPFHHTRRAVKPQE